MHRVSAFRWWLAAVLAATLCVACDHPPDDSPVQDAEQRLLGTWLREYEEDGTQVRRVLVLAPDGHFEESARIVESDGTVVEHHHAGEWHFDGTNLKRRYTRVDGKPPSAPAMPYATFEIRFESRNEFTGIDHVRGREVRYQRVAEGTLP
ncbi:hypothetical protein [Variovorax terrae]|uniref:Lipocalin-like domain-containing protein n=1 Tax=Variovorax terrae TaxID=2923278 RepID=A0A9X2ALR8_9BURK|nr:hypothetical protein [Variovorax terrae]MCJ0762978.1 hypothetical protein [Variovorax terrae]